ncbi:MAG: hypothetical protein K6T17_00015 [Fimbriimonadales bacterium]|nr:hypothetical protein [Fimbriimonadales bacterium]
MTGPYEPGQEPIRELNRGSSWAMKGWWREKIKGQTGAGARRVHPAISRALSFACVIVSGGVFLFTVRPGVMSDLGRFLERWESQRRLAEIERLAEKDPKTVALPETSYDGRRIEWGVMTEVVFIGGTHPGIKERLSRFVSSRKDAVMPLVIVVQLPGAALSELDVPFPSDVYGVADPSGEMARAWNAFSRDATIGWIPRGGFFRRPGVLIGWQVGGARRESVERWYGGKKT